MAEADVWDLVGHGTELAAQSVRNGKLGEGFKQTLIHSKIIILAVRLKQPKDNAGILVRKLS